MTLIDAPAFATAHAAPHRSGADLHQVKIIRTWQPLPVSPANRAGGIWVTTVERDGEQVLRLQLGGGAPARPELPAVQSWPMDEAPADIRDLVSGLLAPVSAADAAAFRFGASHGFD